MLIGEEFHIMSTEELTEVAWSAYVKAVGGKSYNGDPLPTWPELARDHGKEKIVNAWRSAVEAVVAAKDNEPIIGPT